MQPNNLKLVVGLNITDRNEWDYLTCLACMNTDICSQTLNTLVTGNAPHNDIG